VNLAVKKNYGIRRKKIFIPPFYTATFGVGFFGQFILEKKKTTRIWGFRNGKKTEPGKFCF
jgi:hypothetical protein